MATQCSTGVSSNRSLQGTSGVKVCVVYSKMDPYLIPNYTQTQLTRISSHTIYYMLSPQVLHCLFSVGVFQNQLGM